MFYDTYAYANNVLKELFETKDGIIRDAFASCGFDEMYLKEHAKEFSIEYDINDGEKFFHRGKLLFTFLYDIDIETNQTVMKIVFPKKEEK